MNYIIKRNGNIVPFDRNKIVQAINKAFIEVDGQVYEDDTSNSIADDILADVNKKKFQGIILKASRFVIIKNKT